MLLDRGPTPALADQILYGIYGVEYGIYQVTEGSDQPGEQILALDTSILLGLQWLPDGSGFLYSKTGDFSRNANLYEYHFATGSVTPITHFTDEIAADFSISPDGAQIIFARAGDLESQLELWVMDRDGSNMRLLVKNAAHPSWSWNMPQQSPLMNTYLPVVSR